MRIAITVAGTSLMINSVDDQQRCAMAPGPPLPHRPTLSTVSKRNLPLGPWAFTTHELGRRPGAMHPYTRTVPAPAERFGLETIAVPPGSPVELDVRLESVTEGVYVSGTATARVEGECARCLDEVTEELTVELGELFAYPDSITDETTEEDELPRVSDDSVDVEQIVRDAIVLALPLSPLCGDDCRGLCVDCGEKWADLGPDHGHETLDPRWAALRERSSSE
jgi:uncharacterized protein